MTVLEQTGNPVLDQITEDVKFRAKTVWRNCFQTAANFARSRGVRLTPVLREGQPADAIIACVEEQRAEILVLGANSRARRLRPGRHGG